MLLRSKKGYLKVRTLALALVRVYPKFFRSRFSLLVEELVQSFLCGLSRSYHSSVGELISGFFGLL